MPRKHNAALWICLAKLEGGRKALESAARALGQVAAEYGSRDAEYYEQFGYIDETWK